MANWEEQFGIFLISDFYRPRNPPTPNPPPDVGWEQSVRVDLQTISRTRVGRTLLRAIKFHGVVVSILKQSPGHCGDYTFPIEDDLGTGNPKLQITMGPMIGYAPVGPRFPNGLFQEARQQLTHNQGICLLRRSRGTLRRSRSRNLCLGKENARAFVAYGTLSNRQAARWITRVLQNRN